MKNYYKENPDECGLYKWRVESKPIPSVFITFASKFRFRRAGFTSVKSPEFDYWDGYNVLLPKSIEWDFLEEDCNSYDILSIDFNGEVLKPKPCPFCKESPKFKYRGRYINSSPIESDFFYFRCCRWVRSDNFENPANLCSAWNNLIN